MGTTTRNYYDLLGILPSATMVEVKRAYRVMARKHHPDFNPLDPGATERFKDLQEAYNTLRDASARTRYDRTLGFKSSQWTESIEDKDDPVEDLRARRERARAEKRPDDFYYDEPLGPRSDAARAAAEEMRRRIHRAEQQEFWKRASAGRTDSGRFASATFGKRDRNASSGSDATGTGAGSGSEKTAGAGEKAGTGASTGAPGTSGATTGDKKSTDKATAEKTAAERAASDKNTTDKTGSEKASADQGSTDRAGSEKLRTDASASVPPVGDAPPGFLAGKASFWLTGVLFVGLLMCSGLALVRNPIYAPFFLVLAFGLLLTRLLFGIEYRLARLEERLSRRSGRK